jgi:hypothetical protein
MNGDRLAQIEEWRKEGTLGQISVSDVLALVEIAKAARDVADHSWSSLDESMGTMIALRSALARLDGAER